MGANEAGQGIRLIGDSLDVVPMEDSDDKCRGEGIYEGDPEECPSCRDWVDKDAWLAKHAALTDGGE